MEFTKVPATTMQEIQINAGIVVDEFTPATGVIGNILGATGGGVEFNPNPSFKDLGDGIDNMPLNTWQLKQYDHFEPHMTGTFKTMSDDLAALMQPGASATSGHFVPGSKLTEASFLTDSSIKNVSRYRVRTLPAAVALLRPEDRGEEQLSLMED